MSSVLIAPEGSQRLAVGVIGLGNSSQERPRAPFDAARQVRRGAAALRSARSARALVARERRHLGARGWGVRRGRGSARVRTAEGQEVTWTAAVTE